MANSILLVSRTTVTIVVLHCGLCSSFFPGINWTLWYSNWQGNIAKSMSILFRYFVHLKKNSSYFWMILSINSVDSSNWFQQQHFWKTPRNFLILKSSSNDFKHKLFWIQSQFSPTITWAYGNCHFIWNFFVTLSFALVHSLLFGKNICQNREWC